MSRQRKDWDPSKPLLSDQQELFIQLYVVHFDRLAAYMQAYGYPDDCDDAQKATARNAANTLLRDDQVNARKKYLVQQQVKKFAGTKETIKDLAERIIGSNITNYMRWNEDGDIKLVPSDCIDGQLVESLSVSKDDKGNSKRIQLKMVSKEKILEMMALIEGLLVDKNVQSGMLSLEQRAESNKAYLQRMAEIEKWSKKSKKK